MAYQGWAGGFGIDRIVKIASDCLDRKWPDLTIILDINQQTAATRLNRQLDRMEAKGRLYHEKVHEGFLKLAGELENCVIVNATDNVKDVHENILKFVSKVSFS
jgi:thymidylate kinase